MSAKVGWIDSCWRPERLGERLVEKIEGIIKERRHDENQLACRDIQSMNSQVHNESSTRHTFIFPTAQHLPPSSSLILPPIRRTLHKEGKRCQHEYYYRRNSRHNHNARSIRIRVRQVRTRAVRPDDPAVLHFPAIHIEKHAIVVCCAQGGKQMCVLERSVWDAELVGRLTGFVGAIVIGCVGRDSPVVGLAW
jgi:hypothetical protein